MERHPRLTPSAYTIAWISALPIESSAAAEIVDDEHCDPRGENSSNKDQYGFGRIGAHNIIMARLPSGQIGNNSAAAVVARLTAVFTSIRLAFMVGIGGGVPSATSDIRLGDVVVGDAVVQYDFGKTGIDGRMTRTGGVVNGPPKDILHAIAKLRENHLRDLSTLPAHLLGFGRLKGFSRSRAGPDRLFEATYNHTGGESCDRCDAQRLIERNQRESEIMIHYGTIASGNQVMKDGVTRDTIGAELGRRVLCFEMEAAGLASAFAESVVIRGICDYADSHKNKSWQAYAAAIAAAVAKELLLILPAEVAAKSRVSPEERYRIPFTLKGMPVGRFADRPKDLQQLEQDLLPQTQADDLPQKQKILVLNGLGGIGKTQLAIAFARKHQKDFTSVFWLDGDSEDSLKQSIAGNIGRIPEGQIPETIRKYSPGQGDLDAVVASFMVWLGRTENTSWLVVFDNVDRDYHQQSDAYAYDVSNYIPTVDHGSLLITTRLTNLQYLGESLHLENVDITQARAIFRTWYNEDIGEEGDELLQLLDGLPLALAQAAAYINQTGTNFSTYTRLYKEHWRDLSDAKDAGLSRSYGNRSIATTWTVSFNAIKAKNEGAANLLLLWAHLDHRTLPFCIFSTAAKWSSALNEELSIWLNDVVSDELHFLEAIRLLRSYGLVKSGQLKKPQGSYTSSTHPVVHQWAFHMQDAGQREELSRLAALIVSCALLKEYSMGTYPNVPKLFSHAESWVDRADQNIESELNNDLLLAYHNMGVIFSWGGGAEKAERVFRRVLKDEENLLGPGHEITLDTVHNLGLLYYEKGQLLKAEGMFQRLLKVYKEAWGPHYIDHIKGINTIHCLGAVYAKQGKLAMAESMYQMVLTVYEKVGDPKSNELSLRVLTMNNLGLLYFDQGRLEEAEEMCQRALKGYETALGPNYTDYPLVLNVINSLGLVYLGQGKVEEDEEMLQRVLSGYEKKWGPNYTDYPLVLIVINHLGLVYLGQGKVEEAEEMLQRVLNGYEKKWGPDYYIDCPWTVDTIQNIGGVYYQQGRRVEAVQMYERALDVYQKIYGSDDTYIPALDTTYRLGAVFEDLGRISEAKVMYSKTLAGYEKTIGPEYRWYKATKERLEHLEGLEKGSQQELSAGGSAVSHLKDSQDIVLPTVILPLPGENTGFKASKRFRILRKLKLK